MDNLLKNNIKEVIENNPVALATITAENKPNVIAVAYVKVVENQILITDNYMNETVGNIKNKPDVCLAVWNEKWEGCKILGKAQYFDSGEWLEYVKTMEENKDCPAKGAILINVEKIITLA